MDQHISVDLCLNKYCLSARRLYPNENWSRIDKLCCYVALMALAKHDYAPMRMLHCMDLCLLGCSSLKHNIFHVCKPVTGIALIYVKCLWDKELSKKGLSIIFSCKSFRVGSSWSLLSWQKSQWGVQKYQVLFICFFSSFLMTVFSSSSYICTLPRHKISLSGAFYFSHDLFLLSWITHEEGGKIFHGNVTKRQKWNNVQTWHWRKNLDMACVFFFLRAAGTLRARP